MKLFGARVSVRSALQQATTQKYIRQDSGEKLSKKLPKQHKGKVAKALMSQREEF